jgi:hypothetical protein
MMRRTGVVKRRLGWAKPGSEQVGRLPSFLQRSQERAQSRLYWYLTHAVFRRTEVPLEWRQLYALAFYLYLRPGDPHRHCLH